jgi:hypothetical protein
MRKRNALSDQSVDRRRLDVRIPQRTDGVESLLVRAVPKNVWAVVGHLKRFVCDAIRYGAG